MAGRTFVFVGAGALGRAFGTILAAAGHPVILLARVTTAGQLPGLGALRVRGAVDSRAPVRVGAPVPGAISVGVLGETLLPRGAGVVFTTKAHHLAEAAEAVAASWPESGDDAAWAAGVQNGLMAGDLLAHAFGPKHVIGACTVLGAQASADGATVTGLGTTYFGEFGTGGDDRARAAAGAFRAAGLPCVAADDITSVLWAKMCNAAGVFGVSAVTGLATRRIMASPPLVRAYRGLLEETALVAQAAGITIADYPDLPMATYLSLSPEALAERLGAAAGREENVGPEGFSSMAQDVAAGRPTEREAVFGDLLHRAEALGVRVPRIALVNDLIAGIDPAP